jgi:hypothetical protein
MNDGDEERTEAASTERSAADRRFSGNSNELMRDCSAAAVSKSLPTSQPSGNGKYTPLADISGRSAGSSSFYAALDQENLSWSTGPLERQLPHRALSRSKTKAAAVDEIELMQRKRSASGRSIRNTASETAEKALTPIEALFHQHRNSIKETQIPVKFEKVDERDAKAMQTELKADARAAVEAFDSTSPPMEATPIEPRQVQICADSGRNSRADGDTGGKLPFKGSSNARDANFVGNFFTLIKDSSILNSSIKLVLLSLVFLIPGLIFKFLSKETKIDGKYPVFTFCLIFFIFFIGFVPFDSLFYWILRYCNQNRLLSNWNFIYYFDELRGFVSGIIWILIALVLWNAFLPKEFADISLYFVNGLIILLVALILFAVKSHLVKRLALTFNFTNYIGKIEDCLTAE